MVWLWWEHVEERTIVPTMEVFEAKHNPHHQGFIGFIPPRDFINRKGDPDGHPDTSPVGES